MGVVSVQELGRTFEREVGAATILKRRWVCVLSDDTLAGNPATETQIIAATTGPNWGTVHPSLPAWRFRKATINEGFDGSPYHVEVIAEYGVVRDEEVVPPTQRDAIWNFEAGPSEVPAFFYYAGSGNGTTYPLTNSAYDYFPGLTTEESVIRMTVRKNFSAFPASWLQANNFVNNATYFGCLAHSIKVGGVAITYEYEEWGGLMVKYWSCTATLIYRQSGHSLQLPDIGWNYISGGQKRRAMVFDFENAEWVASANPVGLNGSGSQTGGAPAILVRRVNPETDFESLFGTPPA